MKTDSTQLPRIDKDKFVTDTTLMFVKFGDYLLTIEETLEHLKRSGLNSVMTSFGSSGRLTSHGAKLLFNAHRKRFDNDMSKFCRYSAVTTLYSLLEMRTQAFAADFERTYPNKPKFRTVAARKTKRSNGYVATLRRWLGASPKSVKISPRIWNQLHDLQRLRNYITHSYGEGSLLRKKAARATKKIIRRTRGVHIDFKGVLILDAKFALQALERVGHFFSLLFRAAGYGMTMPPGYLEMRQKNFHGFEKELADGIAAYKMRQKINLGGSL